MGASKLQRHALTYFGTAGVLATIATGALALAHVWVFNQTRQFDVALLSLTLASFAASQTLLTTAVALYVATRRAYIPPPMPPLPKAETAALIPAYREEGRIGQVVREAKKYVDVVIVVDDGSDDGTASEAEEAGAVVIKHPHNMGYGAAVKTLLHAALKAGVKYAVLLDGDGQHDPRDISKFIKALESADLAVGDRFGLSRVPTHKKIGISIIRAVHRALGVKVRDPENGYRAFTRRAIEALLPHLDEVWMGISSQTVYMASRLGLRVASVPTEVRYRGAEPSESPIWHGLSVVWTIIWTWLTERPLRTMAIGAAALAASLATAAYVAAIFNATRYIRLTYTALSIVLEVMAVVLIAVAATAYATRRR